MDQEYNSNPEEHKYSVRGIYLVSLILTLVYGAMTLITKEPNPLNWYGSRTPKSSVEKMDIKIKTGGLEKISFQV